ncbi:MAG: MBOAT family O-acyltransferase [Desulfomonilaceae bacterium]
MIFSSPIFVFFFLPLAIGIFLCIRSELRNSFLLLASLIFYAWGEGYFTLVILFSVATNYFVGLSLDRIEKPRHKRMIVAAGISANLILLIAFKYANFLVDNANFFVVRFQLEPFKLAPVHFPLGISFFTFQALSYIVDIYRGDAAAQKNPAKTALYIALFPKVIAGPIVKYVDIASQLLDRSTRLADLTVGAERFIIGLGKKVLVADIVALPADKIFTIPSEQLTAGLAWLGIVCYTLQIYFDFSGYSDMAIGLGRIFGFRFVENFNYPYVSRSVREFWRRWHISLSTWLRDYLYIPLGGSRRRPLRVYLNLIIVFTLCGLWHGASWNFVVWGLLYGFFLVIERSLFGRFLERLWAPAKHLYAMTVIMIAWVFFRAETLPKALAFLAAMFGYGHGNGVEHHVNLYLDQELSFIILLGVVGATPLVQIFNAWLIELFLDHDGWFTAFMRIMLVVFKAVTLGAILVLSSMAIAAGTHNPFIYFQF